MVITNPKIIRVLIDDVDAKGTQGGDGYANYGIKKEGSIVIVRPDGYVGMIAPLDSIDDLETFFGGFSTTKL